MAATGVALVGAGYWGRRLARNLAAADDGELVVVADRHAERARTLADEHGAEVAASLADVLADDAVDAVVLATPSASHATLVGEALASARHVLVEKPLAGTCAEAASLATLADEGQRVLMCDQTYRFAPAVATIRELLVDPAFGALSSVQSCRTNHGHDQPDIDVFWDLAYHDLAILDAVAPGGLRGCAEVRATVADVVGRGRPHRGELVVDASAGWTARVTVDWHAHAKVRTMRFTGSSAVVTWDDGAGPEIRRDGVPVPVPAAEPLAAVVAEFLAAIREGRPAACGPPEELPILAVLGAASASAARDGAPVTVDLDPHATVGA